MDRIHDVFCCANRINCDGAPFYFQQLHQFRDCGHFICLPMDNELPDHQSGRCIDRIQNIRCLFIPYFARCCPQSLPIDCDVYPPCIKNFPDPVDKRKGHHFLINRSQHS